MGMAAKPLRENIMPDLTTITHPQLDTLRSCLNRAEGDIEKAVEAFEKDYVHSDHKDTEFWKAVAQKINDNPSFPEKWMEEQKVKKDAISD